MIKKLNEIVKIYYKNTVHKLKNKKDIRIIEITDHYILVDYKNIYIQLYIDKAEYTNFFIDYYIEASLPLENEIVAFLDYDEFSYLL